MFLGQHRHSLDSKNRLTIPAAYREELGNSVYLLQGFDGNLMLYPAAAFERMAQNADLLSETDPDSRLLKRMLFATASWVEMDKSGRVIISDFLREYAQVTNEVVVSGARDHFDIWSPAGWEKQLAQLRDASVATRFASLRIAPQPAAG